jgi:hypothetical protein
MLLSASTLSANLCARIAQVFGIWRAMPGVDHIHVEAVTATPVEPRVGEGKMSSSRFGGPIPGSRFGAAYERGSPQSLLNHVITGKGPYDD